MRLCVVSASGAPEPREPAGGLWRALGNVAGVVLAAAEPRPNGDGAIGTALDELGGERFDVALALRPADAVRLYDVRADGRAVLVWPASVAAIDLARPERLLDVVAVDLPVDLVGVGSATAALLRELRPEARVREIPAPAADGAEAAEALVAVVSELAAEPPPAEALEPRRLMADLAAAVAQLRIEHERALRELAELRSGAPARAEAAARRVWRSAPLAPVRPMLGPLVRRTRGRG